MLQSGSREISENANSDDIVYYPPSSSGYCNEDDTFDSRKHPASYLSLTHTQ